MRLRLLTLLAPVLCAGEFWTDRKPADWTPAEREQFLRQSPWAKTVTAKVDVTKGAVRSTFGQLSGGNPGALPEMRSVIRWESATIVRAAAGKPLPEEAQGYLVISVTMTGTLSAPETDEEQLRTTSLQAKGQPPSNPVLLLRDEKAGTIYFLFPSGPAVPGDKEWNFETTLGAMELKTRFAGRQMHHRNETPR